MVLLENAIKINGGIDYLAITHADKLNLKENWSVCVDYENKLNTDRSARQVVSILKVGGQRYVDNFAKLLECMSPIYKIVDKHGVIPFISQHLNVPVKIISSGQTYLDKQYLS